MQNISIGIVNPGRIEVTINPENDWQTTVPYGFVFESLEEALVDLFDLYR